MSYSNYKFKHIDLEKITTNVLNSNPLFTPNHELLKSPEYVDSVLTNIFKHRIIHFFNDTYQYPFFNSLLTIAFYRNVYRFYDLDGNLQIRNNIFNSFKKHALKENSNTDNECKPFLILDYIPNNEYNILGFIRVNHEEMTIREVEMDEDIQYLLINWLISHLYEREDRKLLVLCDKYLELLKPKSILNKCKDVLIKNNKLKRYSLLRKIMSGILFLYDDIDVYITYNP